MVQSLDQESTGMKKEKDQINTSLISKKRNKSKTHLSCLIEDNKVITDQDTILKDLEKVL